MRNVLVIILSFFAILSLSAEWIDVNANDEMFLSTSYGLENTEVEFNLPGYKSEPLRESGTEYTRISYANEGEILEIGKPDLPCFTRLLAIPNSGRARVEILDYEEEIISNIVIYPQQELQSESQLKRSEFVKDETFYNSGSVFPAQLVQVGTPAILRGLRVVNLTFNPFQYDPVKQELKVISNIRVAVRTSGFGGENEITRSNFKLSRAFEPLYKASVLNYDELTSREDNFQDPSYLFIHTNDNSVEDALEYLTDWKHQKGFEVSVHGVGSNTAFTTIKAYIQDAYDNWENPPEFVCFLGDAEGSYNIPTSYFGSGGGDHEYARLEGNDILADVYLGRLSFSTILELQTIIYKILNYEKEPYMDQTEWYEKATMVGDPASSGTSTMDTKIHIEEMMLQHNPDYTFHEFLGSGGYSSGMSSTINSGVSYMNYRGFAGMSGFVTTDIYNLNNGFMLPVATFPTCGTGTFYNGTSRSEAFLRVGTPGQPRGAIAAFGTATLSTHTCFNNIVDAGTYYGLFADKIFNMGGALTRGKLALYMNYPYQANYVQDFSYWNSLMGDPGMEVWTGIPQQLVVNYESQLGIGANTIAVNVQDANGFNVENAWVTALMGDDDIFATGYTDENGDVVLEINAQQAGTVNLTVTKHDFIPHLGGFDIGQLDRYVNIFNYQIDDDNIGTSVGNNNGVINPGETIELRVSLKNFGTFAVNNVTASISSNDNYISISDNTENYGDIASGVTVFSPDDFDFSVDANVLGGMEIHLIFSIEDNVGNIWYDYLSLPVEGANLTVSEYDFPANPNGIWEPGETTNVSITLENPGTVAANNVYGILVLDDAWFTINTNNVLIGTVNAGGQINNNTTPFEVTAASMIIPGTQFTADVQLYNADGYDNTTSFLITVGEAAITDPLGPDDYGYYCYDDGDVNYYNVPEYNWIDTSNGTQLSLNDPGETGDTDDITDLPITFKFYGIEYNSLSVSSNGWIAPGQSASTSFMNWQIPGPQGPSPMIAAFWDDLITGPSSSVKYLYDSAQNYFVITWQNMKNEYNTNSLETFQVILYDANYYPTSTGDSEIKFQYQEFNNIDVGNYPSNHGQYCTVGLEDHTGLRGLEYTFNNQYPLQAKQIQDEMALLFTGPPIQFNEPYLTMGGLVLNDQNGNGQADYAETINLDVIVNNIGQQAATNVSAVISSNDPNITITQNTSNYNTIEGSASGTNITPFVFDVAEDCPDGHVVPFTINITTDQNNWELYFTIELNAPIIDFDSIFIDDGNNNILDPGETSDVYVSFINNGGAAAYNLSTVLNEADPYIELNSTTYSFNSISGGTIGTAAFNVTADASAPIGHMSDVDWTMDGDFNYSVSGIFQIVVSQVPVLMEEDFSGTFPPTGWTISGGDNWQQGTGNNAGGVAPEASFYWHPSTLAIQRLISMPLNTAGSSSLDLEFKHYLDDFTGGYLLKVQTTSDGVNWNDAWSITPNGNIGPETINIDVATPDVGSTTFQIAFVFDGSSWNINWWYIDDVHLEGGQGAQLGFIQGTVTLDGGTGDVEDVIVSSGAYTTSPDEFGIYVIPIPAGTHDLTAELMGYSIGEQNDVVVNAGLTTVVDFTLSYLEVPINLAANIATNDVMLTWEMPTENIKRISNPNRQRILKNGNDLTSEKSVSATENSRDLSGFKIYRDDVLLTEISNSSTFEYLDEFISPDDHSYFVTAVYDAMSESEPSNIVNVTIVLNEPTGLQATVIDNDVELNWTAPTNNRSLTGYRVYRNDEEIASTTETTYADEDLSAGSYTYFVKAEYGPYLSDPSNEEIVELTEAINIIIPKQTMLLGNHPNPFNPETDISLALKEDVFVTLEIYNIKGQKIRTLLDDNMEAGIHKISWQGLDASGKQIASGVYFYKMKAGKFIQTKKMIMMK